LEVGRWAVGVLLELVVISGTGAGARRGSGVRAVCWFGASVCMKAAPELLLAMRVVWFMGLFGTP
jgi:hypothetical protein